MLSSLRSMLTKLHFVRKAAILMSKTGLSEQFEDLSLRQND